MRGIELEPAVPNPGDDWSVSAGLVDSLRHLPRVSSLDTPEPLEIGLLTLRNEYGAGYKYIQRPVYVVGLIGDPDRDPRTCRLYYGEEFEVAGQFARFMHWRPLPSLEAYEPIRQIRASTPTSTGCNDTKGSNDTPS
jgi:hypothetical protein